MPGVFWVARKIVEDKTAASRDLLFGASCDQIIVF